MTDTDKGHVLILNASERVFGAERSMAALVSKLAGRGWRLTIASPGGATQELFCDAGVERCLRGPILRMRRTKRPVWMMIQAVRWILGNAWTVRQCFRFKVDAIHANGSQAMLYGLGAALLGWPVVWHVRDLGEPTLVRKMCAWAARAVVAASETVRRDLATQGIAAHVIPNIVSRIPKARLHSNAMEPLAEAISSESRRDAFRIGLVGQLIPRKGQDVLLAAVPAILKRVPGAIFYFIGSGPFEEPTGYERALWQWAQADPASKTRVFFMGYQSPIAPVIASLDVVVIPSRQEAFGRVALEAMAASRPIVAARTGGLAETVENGVNGLLFEPGNAEELAVQVIAIASDPALRERLADGGRRTAEAYEKRENNAVERIETMYGEMMSQCHNEKVQGEWKPEIH